MASNNNVIPQKVEIVGGRWDGAYLHRHDGRDQLRFAAHARELDDLSGHSPSPFKSHHMAHFYRIDKTSPKVMPMNPPIHPPLS